MPQISVIIPVYNKEKYLPKCLDSVTKQTLKDIEIICINDGSNDNSLKILEEYQQNDPRIKIINNNRKSEQMSGAGYCRNIGLTYCTSEYLTFLDADDWFNLNALENWYNKTKQGSYDIIVAQSNNYIEKENQFLPRPYSLKFKLLKNLTEFSYKDIPENIFNFTTPDVWGKLFKYDFIKKNDIKFLNLKCGNDIYFMQKALLCAEKITYIKDTVVFWRVNINQSITSNRYKHSDAWIFNFNKLKQDLIKMNRFELLSKSLYKAYFNLGRYEFLFSSGFYYIIFLKNMFKYFEREDLYIFLNEYFTKKIFKSLLLFKIL